LCIKRGIHINHQPRFFKLRRRCKQHWKTKEKVAADSLISALKKKNKVEEGGASSSKVKREQENIDVRAQKMMRGRVEPFVVPILVQALPIVVHAAKGITIGGTTNDISTKQKTKGEEPRN
jgi:hypothetical protein